MAKALYRKYRPCRLADVVGEEQVTAPLGEALKSGKFGHAYLFTGPRGCGKTSVARIFAHEVNHFKYELEDEYLDIIEIDAASNTGVDNIRELREKATIVPSEGKYKIYIIDEVHMLSKSAFNALLKTLEEPPAHVIFIMATTDPEKVPITVLSRAQVFQFRLVPPEVMEQHLASIAQQEKIPIDPEAIAIIARRGGGSFRDSLSLLDQISTLSSDKITAEAVNSALGLPAGQTVESLLAAYRAADLPGASALLKDYYSTGGKANILAEELISAILAAPDSAYYQLLDQLTSVRDPFAEAKLLLCFMPRTERSAAASVGGSAQCPDGNPPCGTAHAAAVVQSRPSIGENTFSGNPQLRRERVMEPSGAPSGSGSMRSSFARDLPVAGDPQSRREQVMEPSGAPSGSSPAQCPDGNPPCGVTPAGAPPVPQQSFDWPSYIAAVDADSARLRVLLNQSSYAYDGQTLTIIPGNHQAAKAFARPADLEILRRHLPGQTLTIAEFGSRPAVSPSAAKDPTISQISDIMGNIQEVNTQNGGIPF